MKHIHTHIHTADSGWLLHCFSLCRAKYGDTTWRGSRKHFDIQKQTDIVGKCGFRYIIKGAVVWLCMFRRGRARSFQHIPGQPSQRTAAPPSRRWNLCVCGSRLHRAWRFVCKAPELCPHPSAREHLLNKNRQTWEYNKDMCRHIKHNKQCPFFPPHSYELTSEWLGKNTPLFREAVGGAESIFPPTALILPCPKPGVTAVREQAS